LFVPPVKVPGYATRLAEIDIVPSQC